MLNTVDSWEVQLARRGTSLSQRCLGERHSRLTLSVLSVQHKGLARLFNGRIRSRVAGRVRVRMYVNSMSMRDIPAPGTLD